MKYRVDVGDKDREYLRHLHPEKKQRIKESLRLLAYKPDLGKPLAYRLAGLFTCRVGSLRIVYSIDPERKKIHITAIGPRSSIYEELERAAKNKTADHFPPKSGS